jgi:hypothetical protein
LHGGFQSNDRIELEWSSGDHGYKIGLIGTKVKWLSMKSRAEAVFPGKDNSLVSARESVLRVRQQKIVVSMVCFA